MNPVEKVKAILESLTEPLSKDYPFGNGGRKAEFDVTCRESQDLSFQAFVNRVITFRPEYWSSDPNAAIYLAKYGFMIISGWKAHCCSCRAEVDMRHFLGKPDILQTLAFNTHKVSCRWTRVSTPQEYFIIPQNPRTTLHDLKTTFSDLLSFGSNLPIVLKENWLKMGISEDFMLAVLNSFDCPYNETLASCVVLSLCGWVKSSENALQCNFCQRIVGVWNFLSENVQSTKPSASPKKSHVISLLYSEIRRSMMGNEEMEVAENEVADVSSSPANADETEEEVADVSSSPPNADETEEEVADVSSSPPNADETEEEVADVSSSPPNADETEEEVADVSSSPPNADETEEEVADVSSSPPNADETEEEVADVFSSSPPNAHETEEEQSFGSDSEGDEIMMSEYPSLQEWQCSPTFYHAKRIKKKALKILWTKARRQRQRYYYKVLRSQLEQDMESALDHEIVDHEIVDHRHLVSDSEQVNDECKTETFQNNGCENSNNSSRDGSGNSPEKVQDECKSENNGALSDKNVFCSAERSSSEISCTPSVKFSLTTPLYEKDGDLTEPRCEEKISSNNCDSTEKMSEHPEMTDVKSLSSEKSNKCFSNSECDIDSDSIKNDQYEKHNNCIDDVDSSAIPASQSEKSCDLSDVRNDDSLDNSDARRKRKLVPENEQNGTQHDSEMETAQVTKRKRRELEVMKNESLKLKSPLSYCSNGKEEHEVMSGDECVSVCTVKNIQTQLPKESVSSSNDVVNDTHVVAKLKNNPSSLSNHDEDLNTLQGKDNSSSESESSNDPINSSKSVPNEERLDEGKQLENGFMNSSLTDLSENEIEANSLKCGSSQETTTENELMVSNGSNGNDNADNLSEDDVQASTRKRRRGDTDDSDDEEMSVLKRAHLEAEKCGICPSYFHPELEHRFWCIWRIQIADYFKVCGERKKGWEYYVESIKKALELQNDEHLSHFQMENRALNCIEEIVAITKRLN